MHFAHRDQQSDSQVKGGISLFLSLGVL